jgi:class 3 adenylate cyclase
MDENAIQRKLTAILSADVVGYSRLMRDDELATVNTLSRHRQVMFDLIRQHKGRVVDSVGDNLLAEFSSVVDAVQSAVAIQKELSAINADLASGRRMEFRIGINVGDVIQEGERIYGDGVNIAARLENLADPGGICISRTAYDQIESKLPLGYEDLGQKKVKETDRPFRAYRVLFGPESQARANEGAGSGLSEAAAGSRRAKGHGRPPNPDHYYIPGFICLAVGIGLFPFGFIMKEVALEAFLPLEGAGILTVMVGLGLVLTGMMIGRRNKGHER